MVILGIDPGLSGALAWYDGSDLVVVDMPTVEVKRGKGMKRELDLASLRNDMARRITDHVFLERVGAMPGQGVTSMFSFGRSFGQIEAMIAALRLPVTYVVPQVWQRVVGVPKGDDGSRQRASQLLPAHAHLWGRKKDHGRSDAALLALYGLQQQTRLAA